jgi:hypothetical protein
MACSQLECDRPVIARGICRRHYSTLHRKGALPDVPTWPSTPLSERFQRSLTADGECVIWTGHVERNGYGKITDGKSGKSLWVHRLAWELEHGPIPADLTIDHLCRRPLCCNTKHMELVTRGENSRRAGEATRPTACPAGHLYTPENTMQNGPGRYRCRTCHDAYKAARKQGRTDDLPDGAWPLRSYPVAVA